MIKNYKVLWSNEEFFNYTLKFDSKGFIQEDVKVFDNRMRVNEPFKAKLRKFRQLRTCRTHYINNKLFLITYLFLKKGSFFTVSISEVIETVIRNQDHKLSEKICLN
jgi:hypothetical protein